MQKLKKLTAVLLAGVIALSLTACGDKTYYFEKVKPEDYVKLGEYKNLTVSSSKLDSDWASQESSILSSLATDDDISDRTSASGDTVTYNLTATSASGEAIDSLTANAATFTIGTTTTGVGKIEGFEAALTGISVSETPITLQLTMPTDYEDKEDSTLNGATVNFTITVTKITEHNIPSELTDDLIKSYTSSKYTSVQNYQKDFREEQSKNYLMQKVIDNATVNGYPDDEVKQFYHNYLNNYEKQAAQYGYTLDQYLTGGGSSDMNTALFSIKDQAIKSVQESMVTLALYNAEKLDYKDVWSKVKSDYESYDYDKGFLILLAKQEVVLNYLYDNYGGESDEEETTTDKDSTTDTTQGDTTAAVTTAAE